MLSTCCVWTWFDRVPKWFMLVERGPSKRVVWPTALCWILVLAAFWGVDYCHECVMTAPEFVCISYPLVFLIPAPTEVYCDVVCSCWTYRSFTGDFRPSKLTLGFLLQQQEVAWLGSVCSVARPRVLIHYVLMDVKQRWIFIADFVWTHTPYLWGCLCLGTEHLIVPWGLGKLL